MRREIVRRVVLDLDAPTEEWAKAIADLAEAEQEAFDDPDVRAMVALDAEIEAEMGRSRR